MTQEPDSPNIGSFVPLVRVVLGAAQADEPVKWRAGLGDVGFKPNGLDSKGAVPSQGASHAMSKPPIHPASTPHHVSLVALPDEVASTLFGIYDVMNAFALSIGR